MSRTPALAFSLSVQVYGGSATPAGQLLIPDNTGFYVAATAANRATYAHRTEAVALSAYGGNAPGGVSIQEVGTLDASLSGLGTGAASWVRCSTAGIAERFTPVNAGTSDVIGWCETDGRVHLLFGVLTETMLANVVLPALPTTAGSYNLTVAAGPAYSWTIASGGSFDPATLSWSGFWKDFGTAPWSGSASAGPSAGRLLSVTSGVSPAVGANFGVHPSADFNGSTMFLANSTLNLDSFFTRTAYYGEVAFSLDTVAAPGAQPYNDRQLITDNGGNFFLGVSTSGIRFGHYDDTSYKVTGYIACSTLAKHFAQFWYDGVNLNLRLDGGTVVTAAANSLTTAYNVIKPRVGANLDASLYTDGQIARVGLMASVPSSTVRDQLRTDAQTNYGTL